jgi:hypothetical protein
MFPSEILWQTQVQGILWQTQVQGVQGCFDGHFVLPSSAACRFPEQELWKGAPHQLAVDPFVLAAWYHLRHLDHSVMGRRGFPLCEFCVCVLLRSATTINVVTQVPNNYYSRCK